MEGAENRTADIPHPSRFMSQHKFIDRLLPDAWLLDKTILFIDEEDKACAVQGFEIQGQPMDNLSEAHLANWRSVAQTALNNLEPTVHVDFFWSVENDYTEFIQGHKTGSDPAAHPMARHLLEQRVQDYQTMANNHELRHRKLYVFANLELQKSQLTKSLEIRNRLKARREHKLLLSEWKAAEHKIAQVIAVLKRPFSASGMVTQDLENGDIRRIFRKMFSPRREQLRVIESKPDNGRLWNDVILSDIERRDGFLFYDDHYHAFVSMANLPSDTRTGFLMPLFGLSFPDYTFKVTVRTTVKSEQVKALQDDYESKATVVKQQERKGKAVDIELDTQAKEIADEIATLTQTPQQIFRAQILFHVWHDELLELRRRVDEVLLQLGYCHGIQGVTETLACPEALRAGVPGWTRDKILDRFHTVKSANVADLIPASTDFVGTRVPQMIFPTPEAGLCCAHVFTPSRPIHAVVAGETGGGKTFLINSMVAQLVSQGLRSLSVISTKDEFEPLMKLYGGQKISFSGNEPTFTNPCSIAGDMPTNDELASITTILETIFGDIADDVRRKLRESRIHKAAHACFTKYGEKTRLRHFVQAFREGWPHDRTDELLDLAMILEPYAKGGGYGEFFDSDERTPLDLSANFKFFNFAKIKDNANLAAVMMMTLTNAEALRLDRLPKNWRKALILDECWAFVNSGAGGAFIENALRVYRAYNSAVFLSSQQVADFLGTRLEKVVMGNVHNFFLSRSMDGDAIDLMREKLNLTEQLASRFKSMPEPGKTGYAHFIYVNRADTQQIAGEALNRVSVEEGIAYSTSPDLSQLRDHYLRDAPDPWAAICRLAKLSREEIHQETEKLFQHTIAN